MADSWPPRVVATGNSASKDDLACTDSLEDVPSFRHVLLSPDGTTVISSSGSDKQRSSTLESSIIPPNLLNGSRHDLQAYSTTTLPEPVRSIAAYPYFDLSDPSTTLILLSLADHPIRLVNALALDSGIVTSYPYIIPETEEFVAAQSLVFTSDAAHFLAGANAEVGLFDLNRPGPQALHRFKLRRHDQLNQRGHWHLKRGVVSAMAISEDEVLAIGTFGREIGLFERNGQGEAITSFELDKSTRGSGVSQVAWSHCNRYLLVGERKSDAIQVFDIRGQQRRLSVLTGRQANTMMHLKWDLGPGDHVWGGGTDGRVRCWKQIGLHEGNIAASMEWQAHSGPVVSTSIHQSGSVAVTAPTIDRNKTRSLEFEDIPFHDTLKLTCHDVERPLALWALPYHEASADDLPLPALRIDD